MRPVPRPKFSSRFRFLISPQSSNNQKFLIFDHSVICILFRCIGCVFLVLFPLVGHTASCGFGSEAWSWRRYFKSFSAGLSRLTQSRLRDWASRRFSQFFIRAVPVKGFFLFPLFSLVSFAAAQWLNSFRSTCSAVFHLTTNFLSFSTCSRFSGRTGITVRNQ